MNAGSCPWRLASACGCGYQCSSRDEKKKRMWEEGGGEGAPARRQMDRLDVLPRYEESWYEEGVQWGERQAWLREWLEGDEVEWNRVRRRK